MSDDPLGLQLVLMLVEQLDATIQLDASGGTAFKIVFDEPQLLSHRLEGGL